MRVDSNISLGFVLFVVGAAKGCRVLFSEASVCNVLLVGFFGGRRRL